jgi:hypothetical protein
LIRYNQVPEPTPRKIPTTFRTGRAAAPAGYPPRHPSRRAHHGPFLARSGAAQLSRRPKGGQARQAAANQDKEFTRLLGDHLLNVKGFFDYGIKRGLTTPEAFRLTIAKRKETARALVNSGMSQRAAAKVLGVDHATIQRDVAQDAPKSGAKCTTRELLGQSDQNDWRTPRKFLEAAARKWRNRS